MLSCRASSLSIMCFRALNIVASKVSITDTSECQFSAVACLVLLLKVVTDLVYIPPNITDHSHDTHGGLEHSWIITSKISSNKTALALIESPEAHCWEESIPCILRSHALSMDNSSAQHYLVCSPLLEIWGVQSQGSVRLLLRAYTYLNPDPVQHCSSPYCISVQNNQHSMHAFVILYHQMSTIGYRSVL